MGHDGQGHDGGWFLEEVVLDCPQHGEHLIFPAHCWLSDVEADRQVEREFLPEPGNIRVWLGLKNTCGSGSRPTQLFFQRY